MALWYGANAVGRKRIPADRYAITFVMVTGTHTEVTTAAQRRRESAQQSIEGILKFFSLCILCASVVGSVCVGAGNSKIQSVTPCRFSPCLFQSLSLVWPRS